MTTSSTKPLAAAGHAGATKGRMPGPPAPAPVRRHRPRLLLLLGVVLTVLAAVGVVTVFQATSQRIAVVAVAQRVSFGQPITAQALTQAEVSSDPAVQPVAWDQRAQLIGKIATTDLLPGSLVTLGAAAGTQAPAPGTQLVGVEVKPAQMPAMALQPRDRVELVPSASSGGDVAVDAWAPVQATALEVGSPDSSGARVVDVQVASADGPALATRGSIGRVAILLLPRS
jgi:hypothetical protein